MHACIHSCAVVYACTESDDCVDSNGNLQTSLAYMNEAMIPGDIIMMVDGKYVQKMPIAELHEIMRGPLNTVIELQLARNDSARMYTVMLLRQQKHQHHQEMTERFQRIKKEGSIPTSNGFGAFSNMLGALADGPRTPRGTIDGPRTPRGTMIRGKYEKVQFRGALCALQITEENPFTVLSAADVKAVDEQGFPFLETICMQVGDTLTAIDGSRVEKLTKEQVSKLSIPSFM